MPPRGSPRARPPWPAGSPTSAAASGSKKKVSAPERRELDGPPAAADRELARARRGRSGPPSGSPRSGPTAAAASTSSHACGRQRPGAEQRVGRLQLRDPRRAPRPASARRRSRARRRPPIAVQLVRASEPGSARPRARPRRRAGSPGPARRRGRARPRRRRAARRVAAELARPPPRARRRAPPARR